MDDTHTERTERSVPQRFRDLHDRVPDRELLVFTDDDGRDVDTMTTRRLAWEAEHIRADLAARGLSPGARALLVYLPSLDFVSAFLGCQAAGLVPVPVAPPNPFRPGHDIGVLAAVAASSGADLVLTHRPYRELLDAGARARPPAPGAPAWPDLPWADTDRPGPVPDHAPDLGRWHTPADVDSPAFLQYTSGSTGTPKGVVVTHRNIHHELDSIARDLHLGDDTTAVTWVPHFHDLGLISFLLNTLVGHSARTHVLSPLSFLRRPAVWFEVASRVRATHTAAPNFAFDLVVRKTTPEQRAGWDLSSLRVAGSSGELIRPATVERFLAAFADAGFAPTAFYPTYGLAEHTLSLTMGGSGPLRVDPDAIKLGRAVPVGDDPARPAAVYYGCGTITKPGARLRVVDPDTGQPCEPGRVGEIWVDSVTKARGYWGLPDQTREVFEARTADGDPRPYLRTGDLGFLHDGELFVTGRLKDMIIVRGHNHYPQDIEDTVRGCHPLVRSGGVAAFAVPADDAAAAGERLVVLVETTAEPSPADQSALVRAVRRAVADAHGIPCDDVVVGGRGLVLKTTSGKIRRAACRAAYLAGAGGAAGADAAAVAR
ncbi:fatty acyl-AMP ligase [Streptomonospora sp. S1-112]|uniref:Fatty acyl-AMP ligase n=1 Tax=Streptomonospora mangrovi TaxID=2883123 RepID=A0A9X3NLJ7_9ACTN|nr:fatty acyl-AMP ligase [Streptomonospora mangrovi]MDA0564256.1 fatty acyl-AMP ligase [Streptomonospora mangrovi]